MTQSLKDWDESKDAQILGRFKSQGCHFHRPYDLFWMQRRILARGWSRYLVTIALTMYGSWWHEKNKPISNSDAARLYGIGREKAADIYKMLCEEFDLELEPIKTANGRDAGFIMRRVSSTRHIGDSSVVQGTGSVVQEAQVCNAQSTPKLASARLSFSRRLKLLGNDIEAAVISEVGRAVGSFIEQGAIAGTGSSNQPLGLLNPQQAHRDLLGRNANQ